MMKIWIVVLVVVAVTLACGTVVAIPNTAEVAEGTQTVFIPGIVNVEPGTPAPISIEPETSPKRSEAHILDPDRVYSELTTQVTCYVDTGIEGGNLNLRSGPGLAYRVLVELPEGTELTLSVGLDTDFAMPGTWQDVEALGFYGWVYSDFLDCKEN